MNVPTVSAAQVRQLSLDKATRSLSGIVMVTTQAGITLDVVF